MLGDSSIPGWAVFNFEAEPGVTSSLILAALFGAGALGVGTLRPVRPDAERATILTN